MNIIKWIICKIKGHDWDRNCGTYFIKTFNEHWHEQWYSKCKRCGKEQS